MERVLLLNLIAETVGDTVLLTALPRYIKEKHPRCHLAITVPKMYAHFFTQHPDIDETIVVEDLEKIGQNISKYSKAKHYYRVFARLVRLSKTFDTCFVLQPNFAPNQLIPFFARCKRTYGYTYPGSLFSRLLDKTTPWISWKQQPNRHYVESYLDILRLAQIPTNNAPIARVEVLSDDAKRADKILRKHFTNKPIIGIQAGAKWTSKQWSVEKFAKVCKHIIKTGGQVALLGSPAEHALNEQIRNLTDNQAVNLSGAFGFDLLPAICSKFKYLLGNDSGLTHLASAVGTNTVVLYGSTNPPHSRPIGPAKWTPIISPKHVIDIQDSPKGRIAMDAISAEQVINALKKTDEESRP